MGPVSKNAVVIGFGAILVELRHQRATLHQIKALLEKRLNEVEQDLAQQALRITESERDLRGRIERLEAKIAR